MCFGGPVVYSLLFAIGFVPTAAPAEAPSVDAVLAQVGKAIGVAAFPNDHSGLKATGTIKRYGVEAPLELIIDGRGRFRMTSGGPLGETHIFDGVDAWATDWSGATRRVELQDRDTQLMYAWLCTVYWGVKPELFDLAIVAKECTDKEAVLSVKRKGG